MQAMVYQRQCPGGPLLNVRYVKPLAGGDYTVGDAPQETEDSAAQPSPYETWLRRMGATEVTHYTDRSHNPSIRRPTLTAALAEVIQKKVGLFACPLPEEISYCDLNDVGHFIQQVEASGARFVMPRSLRRYYYRDLWRPTLRSRIRDYLKQFRLDDLELARIWRVTPGLVHGIRRGRIRASQADIEHMALRLGVNPHWLSGEVFLPKWGPEVMQLRTKLREQVHSIEADNPYQRIAKVIILAQRLAPLCRQDWFLSGVTRITPELIPTLEYDFDWIGQATLYHIALFTDIHYMWLLSGDPVPLDPSADVDFAQ